MRCPVNLANKLKIALPSETLAFMRRAAELAAKQDERLYLIGGAVRDLLLGHKGYDIDLAVEGDAIGLARKLTDPKSRAEFHPQFGTAKLEMPDGIFIDITSARKETYARPGALPSVLPGNLRDDLFRRDFTINALAVSLNSGDYGELIDCYGGLADIEKRLIRVLHDKSFIDDATRIWRAIRYSARLDFAIESHTLELLARDRDYLDTISGDRIRYEIECVFGEDRPEKAIELAAGLGVLQKLNPGLKGNGLIAARFRRAREVSPKPPFALYLALLTCPLAEEGIEQLISYLHPDRLTARVLRESNELRAKADVLSGPNLTPAELYQTLHGYNPLAVEVVYIESNDATVWQHIDFYENFLRKIRPLLTGKDIQKMGVPEGPEIRVTLEKLLEARLNGNVKTREDEEKMVRELVRGKNQT